LNSLQPTNHNNKTITGISLDGIHTIQQKAMLVVGESVTPTDS